MSYPTTALSSPANFSSLNTIPVTIASLSPAVVVESFPGTPPLNLDTVLFVGPERQSFGQVFDVFGPVTQPLYVVRFNSAEDVALTGARLGEEVYFAPSSNEHTHYVVVDELLRCVCVCACMHLLYIE